MKRLNPVLLVGLCVAVGGCEGWVYVTHLAEGQLGIQGRVESIDVVLASGRLMPDEQGKLELIVAARNFARDTIGLNVGDSYSAFYDTAGDPLAFNLSASRKDALEPVTWTFPIVGKVPYLAFFDQPYLERVEQQLIDAGFDTTAYELDAYSTLGVFADPVRSTMLKRNVISLADTIVHELLHNTIWRPNDTTFNESLATFVGRTGSMQFLRQFYGEDSNLPAIAEALNEDTDRVNGFLLELYRQLEAHYAQPLTADALVAGREAVFEAGRQRFVQSVQPALNYPNSFGGYAHLPTNNAWMLGNYRYNLDLDVFEDVFNAVGGDWRQALDVFGRAAKAPGDPVEFLRNWLASR